MGGKGGRAAWARRTVDSLREGARAVSSHRLRSGLGVLAVAAAVGTIAVVRTSLEGLARSSRETAARSFGSSTFVIARVAATDLGRKELAERLARNPVLSRSDLRFLRRHGEEQVLYAPLAERSGAVSAGARRVESATIAGTAAELEGIRELGIERGRFLRPEEDRGGAQVVVLGAELGRELFPGLDPLDRLVRIGGRGFRVVGVQAPQGSAGGQSLDRRAWIPYTSWERLFGSAPGLQVHARAVDPEAALAAEDRARATMRARRQLGPGEPDSFDLVIPEAARSFITRLSGGVSAAVLPISLMALLAASVVVTNTNLVSVSQRTREIGIRRAVGASRSQVVLEVLAESLLVATLGGGLGLAGAGLLLRAASGPLGVALPVGPGTLLVSLGAATASGLAAGLYPARLAARIDIVAAVRTE